MPAFCPIVWGIGDDYSIPLIYNRKGSHFIDVEFVSRSMLEAEIKAGQGLGIAVEPYISHGVN